MEPGPSAGAPVGRARADRREFRNFLGSVWAHLGLPAPTPIQLDIARFLHRGPRRRLVLAFRGVGKSWIYAAYLVWRLWRRPDAKILLVSATQAAADGLAQFSRRLIREMPAVERLRPRPDQRDGSAVFDVGPARASKDPSVKAIGIGGQITGARADEILADDVETLNNSMTAAARARLSEQIREFDAVLKPGGRITFLGTPQGPDSVYARLTERGYATRVWPAEIPVDPSVYDGALAPLALRAIALGGAPGDPLDPDRFGPAELAIRRKGYGRVGYARQFLLDSRPADPESFPLRIGDLIVTPIDPHEGPVSIAWGDEAGLAIEELPGRGFRDAPFRAPASRSRTTAPYTDSVLAIDPSGRGRDETAYALLKALNGRLFLLEAGGCDGGYEERTLERLAQIAARFGARRIAIESNFGDGMFTRLLEPFLRRAGVAASVQDHPALGAKEARIVAALEPLLAQHRLVVDEDLVRRDAASTEQTPFRSLFYQIARIRPERGALEADDRIDALALGVGVLAEALSIDEAQSERRRRAAAARAEARALLTAIRPRGGRPGRRLNWRRV